MEHDVRKPIISSYHLARFNVSDCTIRRLRVYALTSLLSRNNTDALILFSYACGPTSLFGFTRMSCRPQARPMTLCIMYSFSAQTLAMMVDHRETSAGVIFAFAMTSLMTPVTTIWRPVFFSLTLGNRSAILFRIDDGRSRTQILARKEPFPALHPVEVGPRWTKSDR